MWLKVIISLFALPNQITSGDLVSDQATFDFMTINILCDRQCTVSCFVISFEILQHRVYLDRDCVLSGAFRLSRSTCDACFDQPRSNVLALHGTSTTVCASALSEVFVFQLCRCSNTKTSLKAEAQTVVEVPCKARTLLRGWSKHASQLDWESRKDPDSTQSRSK